MRFTGLHQSSYRYDCSVSSIIADLDTIYRIGRMYDLSISDIKSNMVDSLSGTVADNITRAHLGAAYHTTHTGLSAGRMRKFNFCCVTHYIGCKSRTVNSACQAFSAPFIC